MVSWLTDNLIRSVNHQIRSANCHQVMFAAKSSKFSIKIYLDNICLYVWRIYGNWLITSLALSLSSELYLLLNCYYWFIYGNDNVNANASKSSQPSEILRLNFLRGIRHFKLSGFSGGGLFVCLCYQPGLAQLIKHIKWPPPLNSTGFKVSIDLI